MQRCVISPLGRRHLVPWRHPVRPRDGEGSLPRREHPGAVQQDKDATILVPGGHGHIAGAEGPHHQDARQGAGREDVAAGDQGGEN